MLLQYAGPGPQDDGQGGIVRPGEVRHFAEAPAYGPWLLVDGDAAPGGPVSPPAGAPTQSPAGGSEPPGAASTTPAGSTSAPATQED